MTKSRSAIYSIITVFALNIAFFFCNYYPRHIVEIKGGVPVSALLIFANLLHFALMGFMLILAFGEGTCIFSDGMFRRFLPKGAYIKKLLLLLAVQIIVDFIRLPLSAILGEYYFFLDDAALPICWLAAYLILSDKESRFYNNRRRAIITFAILAAAVCVFVLPDALAIQRYHISCEKYTAFSNARGTIVMNLSHMHNLRLVILDSILGAVLIIAHSVRLGNREKQTGEMKPGKIRTVSTALLRIALIAAAVYAFCMVKLLICPDSSDGGFSYTGSSSTDRTEYDGEFCDMGIRGFSIHKYSGILNKTYEYPVYSVEKATLYFEKQKLGTVLFDGDPLYSYRTENGALKRGSKDFIKEDVGGITVWIYCNRYLCWEENGRPVAVRYEDISSHRENATLTAVCERLISQGNIVAFDFAAEYLEKYAPDFIEPYIKRYAAGDFTDAEREFISLYEYREEYLMLILR